MLAAQTAVRWSGDVDCPPPADVELDAFHELERAVVGGRFGEARPSEGPNAGATAVGAAGGPGVGVSSSAPFSKCHRTWRVMLTSLASWLRSGFQMSAPTTPVPERMAASSAGRVRLRLRMSRRCADWWRELESRARRGLPRGMSWLRFLCVSVWQAWGHLLGARGAYGHIYVRDRFRCTSPVCNRRDVTPHHIRFRSAGGSDEDHNITGICTWCHLHGVHGGRIRAVGTADRIRWELGPRDAPTLIVHGRERQAHKRRVAISAP